MDSNTTKNQEEKEVIHKENPLTEYGKEYFKALLSNEHQNLKFGDEMQFGIAFYGKDGKLITKINRTIHRNDLVCGQLKK